MLAWRRRFRAHLDRIVERYPPKIEVDFDSLADMMSALADGGIILSKALKDRTAAFPPKSCTTATTSRLLFEPD